MRYLVCNFYKITFNMRTIFVILIAMFIASYAHAQIPGFNIGPKVGFNTRKLTSDFDSIKADPSGSFQVGAFMRIGKKVYVQPEVYYIIRGGSLTIGGLGSQQIKMKSVTVPVLIGVRPINTGLFNLRFMAGPAITFVNDITLTTANIDAAWPIRTEEDIKKTNWSFQLGGGVDLLKFTLDFRYEIGVDNIYSGEEDFKLRNNLFNISLGLKLL
jgi:hypothetical protein